MQEHSALLNDQMAQWAELHKMSGAAMKEVIVRLWPAEPIPSSYFGLVRRLIDVVPRIDAIKRSVCIEGAQRAFARIKEHWAKMKAAVVVVEVLRRLLERGGRVDLRLRLVDAMHLHAQHRPRSPTRTQPRSSVNPLHRQSLTTGLWLSTLFFQGDSCGQL